MATARSIEMARILSGFHDELKKMDGVTANSALVGGGADGDLTRTGGKVAGKTNIIAQRTLVRGDLRTIRPRSSPMQRRKCRKWSRTTCRARPPRCNSSRVIRRCRIRRRTARYFAQLDAASRDPRHGRDHGLRPARPRRRRRGVRLAAAPTVDGLGLGGKGEHTMSESADLSTAPDLVKRAAVLIFTADSLKSEGRRMNEEGAGLGLRLPLPA